MSALVLLCVLLLIGGGVYLVMEPDAPRDPDSTDALGEWLDDD